MTPDRVFTLSQEEGMARNELLRDFPEKVRYTFHDLLMSAGGLFYVGCSAQSPSGYQESDAGKLAHYLRWRPRSGSRNGHRSNHFLPGQDSVERAFLGFLENHFPHLVGPRMAVFGLGGYDYSADLLIRFSSTGEVEQSTVVVPFDFLNSRRPRVH